MGSIEEFYSEVQHLLSLLINHSNISTENPALRADRIKTHQANDLQVFLAGLKEPIGGNVRARKPAQEPAEERNFQNRFGLHRVDALSRAPKPNYPTPLPPPPQKPKFAFDQRYNKFGPQRQPFNPPKFVPFQRSFNQYQQPPQLPPRNPNVGTPFNSNKPNIPPRNTFAPPRPVSNAETRARGNRPFY